VLFINTNCRNREVKFDAEIRSRNDLPTGMVIFDLPFPLLAWANRREGYREEDQVQVEVEVGGEGGRPKRKAEEV
jgi:cell division FtsZ-interacting protein ZapD